MRKVLVLFDLIAHYRFNYELSALFLAQCEISELLERDKFRLPMFLSFLRTLFVQAKAVFLKEIKPDNLIQV